MFSHPLPSLGLARLVAKALVSLKEGERVCEASGFPLGGGGGGRGRGEERGREGEGA